MYRLNLRAAAYPKRAVRLNPPLRPFLLLTHFSRRPPSPAGIDDSEIPISHTCDCEDENEIPISGTCQDKNEYERKVLPPELRSRDVVMLTCDSAAHGGICDVYLIGTNHESKIVFLELCSARRWLLDQGLAGEFNVAYKEARKYGGKVILGDRPDDITMKRAWAKMPLFHKAILMPFFLSYGIFLPSTEDHKSFAKRLSEWDVDEWDAIDVEKILLKLHSIFPAFVETLVYERDRYMSAKLLQIASKHNSIVAVVGKGHLPGIQKHWKQPVDMEELVRMPTGMSRIITPKKVLPPELHSRNVVMLTCDSAAHGGICDVYLAGTVHDSTKSSREVEAIIKFLQPQIAFLELCYSRPIGAEFAVAYKEARKYGGRVIFGDQPISITLKRTWAKMPLRHKIFLLWAFLSYVTRAKYRKRDTERADECDGDDDFESGILVVQSYLPTVIETLVHKKYNYFYL